MISRDIIEIKALNTNQRVHNGETCKNVLKHSIIQHLHEAIPQLCVVARHRQDRAKDESFIFTKVSSVLLKVRLIIERFLHLV